MDKKKVLLVMPGRYGLKDVNLPISLLFLSKALLSNGYEPVIFDCRVRNYKKILRQLDTFSCVGITTMSGKQVKYALEVSKYIKSVSPDLKIVWGGPHCSAVPEQTIENENVDIAVIGEGEEALVEILEAIGQNKGLGAIQGIAFKDKNAKITVNPRRPLRDINKSVNLPYHLLDIEKDYPITSFNFEYLSSKGCPHQCGFCSNEVNYRRKWLPKSPEVMVGELDYIIKNFKPRCVSFIDANFFVSRQRAEKFCELAIKQDWDIEFYAMIRCDYITRYGDDFFRLLKRANFKQLAFGAESGDDAQLELITKGVTVKQSVDSVDILKKHGFAMHISMMMGFPFETQEQLNRTLALYDKIVKMDKKALVNGIFVFTPFPSARLTDIVTKRFNYKLPDSLEEWSQDWRFNSVEDITWVDKNLKSKYEGIKLCAMIMYVDRMVSNWPYKEKLGRFGSHLLAILISSFSAFFYLLAKLRWRLRFFYFPLDLKIWHLAFTRTKEVV